MSTLKEQLARHRTRQPVPIGDMNVYVRVLSIDEAKAIREQVNAAETQEQKEEVGARLLSLVTVDEDGNQVFDSATDTAIGQLGGDVLAKILDAALDLNKLRGNA